MVTRPGFPYLFVVLELWFAEGFAEGTAFVLVPTGAPALASLRAP